MSLITYESGQGMAGNSFSNNLAFLAQTDPRMAQVQTNYIKISYFNFDNIFLINSKYLYKCLENTIIFKFIIFTNLYFESVEKSGL